MLADGTENSQGKEQIISNINAVTALVDIIKTTLGPRGMDKLIATERETTISNDGATIIKLLQIVHPAAQSLCQVAISQDNQVGDGTTSVTIFAGELLKEARGFIEDGLHSQEIIAGYWHALSLARRYLDKLAHRIDMSSPEERRSMLIKCASTSLNSKLICTQKNFFSEMIVDACENLEDSKDKRLIGLKHVTGGGVMESFIVKGVAFEKTFSYAGFEQQPKSFTNPRIIVLNVELELKAERENAEIRIENPDDYQKVVDAEWKIIYEKLDNIVESKADIVLSKLPIGDLATQYFADRNIFCAGRVPRDDLDRVVKATGAKLLHSCNSIREDAIGTCGKFEERQIGASRYNIFEDCTSVKTATIVLRGGAEQFIAEAERSIHDAIMVVRRASKATSVVAGGGAIEMELSKLIKEDASTIEGKQQVVVRAFAKALEVIPRTLAQNSGLDSVDIINQLRKEHLTNSEGADFGVECIKGEIVNTFETAVWEPTMLKQNVLSAATEATNMILSIDQTIKNPKSEQAKQDDLKRRKQLQAKLGRGGMMR